MRLRFAFVLLLAPGPAWARADTAARDAALAANRLTWGVSAVPDTGAAPGSGKWLDAQLTRPDDTLPPAIAAQIAAMRISRTPMAALVVDRDAANRSANGLSDPAQRDAARKAYQQSMNALADEAATRSLLRDIYAPDQLREQMTWFWFNHFNVQAQKRDIRAMVGDYEDTIRAHAFGKFRDLLEATLKHPAMLRYLDNDQNAAKRINENYAREIMELHSMGVGSGYTQKDVQELARILTGVGIRLDTGMPKLGDNRRPLYIRDGLFEFDPARHDFGDKQFLGHAIRGRGFGEVEEALDLIARSPATAHHVSQQIATFFTGDDPPAALVDRMADTWRRSDGDIAAVLRTMTKAREFRRSPGTAFKDPVHYVVSAVRLMYGDRTIVNAQPILGWLNRMGEGLYTHETPDGFPLESAAWTGPGQMSVRFEIARQIGGGAPALFNPPPPPPAVMPPAVMGIPPQPTAASGMTASPPSPPPPASPPLPPPRLQDGRYAAIAPMPGERTRAALARAATPAQWNALFLSSPEFMRR